MNHVQTYKCPNAQQYNSLSDVKHVSFLKSWNPTLLVNLPSTKRNFAELTGVITDGPNQIFIKTAFCGFSSAEGPRLKCGFFKTS